MKSAIFSIEKNLFMAFFFLRSRAGFRLQFSLFDFALDFGTSDHISCGIARESGYLVCELISIALTEEL